MLLSLQGERYTGILYYLSGALMLCSSLSAFLSSETRGVALQDTLGTKNIPSTENSDRTRKLQKMESF